MTQISNDANVHQSTLYTIAQPDHKPMFRKKRKPRTVKTDPPVERKDIHPAAWQAALRLARGDARRIEIVSQTNLVVRNS